MSPLSGFHCILNFLLSSIHREINVRCKSFFPYFLNYYWFQSPDKNFNLQIKTFEIRYKNLGLSQNFLSNFQAKSQIFKDLVKFFKVESPDKNFGSIFRLSPRFLLIFASALASGLISLVFLFFSSSFSVVFFSTPTNRLEWP